MRAASTIASAKSAYDGFFVHVAALLRLQEEVFGPTPGLDSVFSSPADAWKLEMVVEIFVDAFDNGYPPPTPAELALVAVVLGVDGRLTARSKDTPENRRARWRQSLDEARKLVKKRGLANYPPRA